MDKVNEFEHGPDNESTFGTNVNYTKFSMESNLHYRFSSAEDLLNDKSVLAGMIKDHYDNQVPRLAILDDYYKAKNTNIMKNRRRKEKHKADHRAAHNRGKVLASFDVGYNTGNPIKIQVDGDKKQQKIDEFNANNDIDGLNSELWLDMDKYGRAYELHFRDKQDKDWVRLSNVFETFVVYDTTIMRNPIAAVRYPKTRFSKNVDKTMVQPTVYTAENIITFNETKLSSLKLEGEIIENHNYKEVPIVEYSPNRFRMGLYEDVLSLFDLYDAAQSDTANYMTDLNDALLVISGDIEAAGLTTEDAIKQKEANMLLLQSGIDVNGNKTSVSAGYIYKQYDVDGVEAYKDRIRKDIHDISMIPDLQDNNFSGVQSGEAMKYKLFGFEQMTSTKQRLFKGGLTRRYRLLFNLQASVTEVDNSELEGFKVIFTPNMPKAILEELKSLIDAGATISQETILGLASFIDDVKDELERVAEENQPIALTDEDKERRKKEQAEFLAKNKKQGQE